MIYVFVPSFSVTGGPELLHQLCNEISKNGVESAVVYRGDFTDKAPKEYEKYNVKVFHESQIILKETDFVIFPEIWSREIIKAKAQKILYWLSVDNAQRKRIFEKRFFKGWPYKTFKKLFGVKSTLCKKSFKINDIFHISQSEYSSEFIRENGAKSISVTDYINTEFIEKSNEKSQVSKEDIVLYNPRKGFAFTKKIIKKNPNINFVPLTNLSREQVIELLLKAKVYIDFGYHPGKDRFPREAALMNCIVITNKKGSAENNYDVAIPSKFKIKNSVRQASELIAFSMNYYENEIKNFENYKSNIQGEPQKFNKEVSNLIAFLKIKSNI